MDSLLDKIVKITYEAGAIALNYQLNGFKSFRKDHNELVTEADIRVNEFLKDKLLSLIPESGWLSEESVDNKDRLSKRFVWIIDPIDGTFQFSKGSDEWVISIALVESNKPIIGVIYNPRKNQMFFAERCLGAYLNDYKIEHSKPNGQKPILLTTKSKTNFFRVFSHGFHKNFKIEQIGSIAYVCALTALGYSTSCISFKKCSEWDVAAAFLILKETGCIFNILGNNNDKNDAFMFNKEDVIIKHGFLATNKQAYTFFKLKN